MSLVGHSNPDTDTALPKLHKCATSLSRCSTRSQVTWAYYSVAFERALSLPQSTTYPTLCIGPSSHFQERVETCIAVDRPCACHIADMSDIGGLIASLISLSLEVFKAYKSAPKTFYNLHLDMISLQTTLLLVKRDLPEEADLVPILTGCSVVLEDIERTLKQYQELGSANTFQKLWFTVTNSFQDVEHLRTRLMAQVSMLQPCAK